MKNKPKERKGSMLCYEYTEKRLLKWNTPWIVQPKFEGDRCRAIYDPVLGWLLYSSTMSIIKSVPHINKALFDLYGADDPPTLELDGELYKHGMRHEDIRSIVSRTVDRHPNYEEMEYHIFDWISEKDQLTRASDLCTLPEAPPIHIAKTYTVRDLGEFERFYSQFVSEGYEGIVVRNPEGLYKRSRSTDIMKLKPRNELTVLVIGLVEEETIHGKSKNSLGAVVCRHPEIRNEFEVGTGFTREERERYWRNPEDIIGRTIEITYQSLTKDSIKMTAFKRIVGEY